MKRFLLILFFLFTTATQAQVETLDYSDINITYIGNQANSPSIVLRTTSDRQCWLADCPAQLVLIHKESQRVVLDEDARGLVWMQISSDGQRIGLYYLRGRPSASAETITTLVEIRSLEDGSVLFSREFEPVGLEAGAGQIVRPLFTFSADLGRVMRQTAIDYTREISVWDVERDVLVYARECDYGMFGLFDQELLSPDGKYLLYGCGNEAEPPQEGISGTMELIEVDTGEVLQEIDRYHWSSAVKWDDTSSYFVVDDYEYVRFYTVEGSLTEIPFADAFRSTSDFTLDSQYFFIIGASVHIVNLEDGSSQRISPTSFRSSQIGNVSVSPDSSQIFLGGEANRFAIVNLESGEIEAQDSISSREFGYNRVGDTWHPEGRYAAVCGDTSSVFLWDSESEEIITLPPLNFPQGASSCQLSFSSDGRYLAYERHLNEMSGREYSVGIAVFELETMSVVFEEQYVFGAAALTVLEWQTGRNRLFVTNPAEMQIEVHEFD